MRKYGLLNLLLLLFLFLPPTPMLADTPVKVGIYQNAPLAFLDDNGIPGGIYVDILTDIAAKEGWPLEYVPCVWAECLESLERGEIDLLVAIAYSAERAQRLDFSAETVLANWGQVYVPPNSDIASVLDLQGKRLAVIKGDIYYRGLQDLLKTLNVAPQYVEVGEYAQALELVAQKEVDAGLISRIFGARFEADYTVARSPIILTPTELRFAAPKGKNPELLNTLDRHLAGLKADPQSVYHQSVAQWLGGPAEKWYFPNWLKWALLAGIGILGLVAGLSLLLSAQVRARTAELADKNRAMQIEIAGRQYAQEALKDSLSKIEQAKLEWESTVDSLPQLVCLLDRQRQIMRANRSLERWDLGRIITVEGQDVHALLHPHCADAACPLNTFWVQAWAALAEDRPSETELEDTYLKRYLRLQVRPISSQTFKSRNKDELENFAVLVVEDITERRHLYEQLRQAQKMEAVGRLAGGVAHDFNNILTVITGFSDLILRRLANDDPIRKNLIQIRAAADRAAALTNQLLAFSRKQILQPQIINLNQTIAGAQKMLKPLIGEDINLITALNAGTGYVKADPGQMEQVIMNLAVNARDAMPHGGTLTIETGNVAVDEALARQHLELKPGPYVRLTVSDTGQGMNQETLAQLFEPFFTTKEQGKGTGLGLATVHGIITQSNGYITVTSEPGQGAAFNIYLPRVEETAASTANPEPAPRIVGATETILLAEDEAMVRQLARDILMMEGYTILEAGSGQAALELAAAYNNPIHLLLTDVVMPGGMSGQQLAQTLAPLRPAMKILYMSGYTENTIVQHGVLDPSLAFLQKPFAPDTLLRKVRETLNRPAAPQPEAH